MICTVLISCKDKKAVRSINSVNINHNVESCKNNFQEDTITIEYLNKYWPYDSKTNLKNDYKLKFSYFRRKPNEVIEKCLVLMKNKKIIDTLNTLGYAALDKNLGYVVGDFENYFVFVQSFGSGNPHEIQLIRKKDAKKILEGYYAATDEKNELLLYYKGDDSLMYYNVKSKKNKLLVNLKNCDYIHTTINNLDWEIKKVTKKQIEVKIIENENDGDIKQFFKKYSI